MKRKLEREVIDMERCNRERMLGIKKHQCKCLPWAVMNYPAALQASSSGTEPLMCVEECVCVCLEDEKKEEDEEEGAALGQ